MSTVPATPLPYRDSDERESADEPATREALSSDMREILETTWADYGHAVRSVHAKSHALIEAALEVPADLPGPLAQGLFARAGNYPVVMRLSTNPGDVLDDSVSAPRGLAIKIHGVEGERLPGSEADSTQDFLFVDAPAFSAPDAAAFDKTLKALAATTDRASGLKKAISGVLRGVSAGLDWLGTESATVTTLGGQPAVHPLGDTYYTTVPFRHGEHVAKLSLAPATEIMRGLTDRPIELAGRPNALREEMIEHFATHGAAWELRAQLRTNPDTMPIEDATVEWPESESPYLAVGRIVAPAQPVWSEARARTVDDGLAFSPWHGLAAHRPLGSINRARNGTYAMSASFRGARTGCPMHEPREAPELPRSAPELYGAPGREGRRDLPADA